MVLPILAGAGAVTSLVGSLLGSKAQNKAAKAQQQAYADQLAKQQQIAAQAQASFDNLLPMFTKDENTAARYVSADERNRFSDQVLAGVLPQMTQPSAFRNSQAAGMLARLQNASAQKLEQQKRAQSMLQAYFDALQKQQIKGTRTAADIGLQGTKSRAYAAEFPLKLAQAGTAGSGLANTAALLQGVGNIGMFAGMMATPGTPPAVTLPAADPTDVFGGIY